MSEIQLHHGDCVEVIHQIETASVDAVICDPPYPCIRRDYGMLTEGEWMTMMQLLVPEIRRVLKPQGSAVFVLQPNSQKLGSMRLWLWKFMVWVGEEWNIIQDAYWWNFTMTPEAHSIQGRLMRPSLKTLVWCGPSDCYRNQDAVLWEESQGNTAERLSKRQGRHKYPSGHGTNKAKHAAVAERRGGVTPFNVLPISNGSTLGIDIEHKHGATTPVDLADWWTRYICPPNGVVFDPFMGSGTMGLAAIHNNCGFIGIEKMSKYYALAKARIEAEAAMPHTLPMELSA